MPNYKLSEYQAKNLFHKFNDTFFNADYINLNKLDLNIIANNLVVKVDDGSKRRMKKGLVKLNQSKEQIIDWVKERNDTKNYFIEEMIEVVDEYYVMIRPEDDYDVLYINNSGGIDQLDPLADAKQYKIHINDDPKFDESELNPILINLFNFYKYYHITFLEVNPLAKTKNGFEPLDFAVLIDDCSFYLFDDNDKEILELEYLNNNNLATGLSGTSPALEPLAIESYIHNLDLQTGGSLKFKLLNPEGTIWTMIAGGGASVVYTDAIVNLGYKNELANYGEYSGNPPSELVYKYADAIFKCMNEVNKDKILFIGGGIANFTDIKKTFTGLLKAIEDNIHVFKTTKIYVRRGGPNYKEALQDFRDLAKKYNLDCKVYGPEIEITTIVSMGLEPLEFTKLNLPDAKIDKEIVSLKDYSPIKYDLQEDDQCIIYSYQPSAVQRMLDFDYINGRKIPSIAAVIDPRKLKNSMDKFFWGGEPILISVINNIEKGLKKFNNVKHIISFASFRSAYESTMILLDYEQIISITIIAEGIPERHARIFNNKARKLNKLIIGPATVGGIKPGCLRIGNTGGSLDNIIDSKLYRRGNVAFVTRSGGLLNELCNIISKKTNGVYQGISIGGDRNPGSNFLDHIMNYQNIDNVKIIILLGEVGGIQELMVSNAVKEGYITKPVIGWCMGTSADYFTEDVQFGHAGASANAEYESANFKNKYMKESGIHVPDSFEELSSKIEEIYKTLNLEDMNNEIPRIMPITRKDVTFFSSISNEMGEELMYNGIPISEIVDGGIGKTIGHLWLKKDLPNWMCKYIELVIMITADHGAMVSGAHNTIVASRAGKDLISSLCSGLLTIGDYFGGALNDAGKLFYKASNKEEAKDFVSRMNREHKLISGIGHKIKTKDNPDKRVELLYNFVKENFPQYETINYGFMVEKITLQKRNNLILNVDGFIACSLIDCMLNLGFNEEEINEILENGLFNGFFVLGRTIGFIGHWYDQKRLKQGLFRLNNKDIKYLD